MRGSFVSLCCQHKIYLFNKAHQRFKDHILRRHLTTVGMRVDITNVLGAGIIKRRGRLRRGTCHAQQHQR
ncbi:hypothetical protein [Candidatus Symbiopectobacterium sp.]|uniref:hypothetical protein n=1 Tax=Candidatus Symbiopectobacterium sp. TaxID=2816440 RepID=UPI0025C3211B|nr:hypothetical protein [Candidatus Symbiopectobacterium sp.]